MAEEELLFLGQKSIGFAQDRTQRGGHLHCDHQKNQNPNVQSGKRACAEMPEARMQKTQSKNGCHEPKREMQRAHHCDGLRGL